MSAGSSGSFLRQSLLVFVGFLTGWLASMAGIGGGLFAVPVLHYGMGLVLRRAVATALMVVLATTVAATVSEALLEESAIRWALVVALASGAVFGTHFGYRAAKTIPVRRLKSIFVIVLAVVGLRVLTTGVGATGVVYGTGALDGALSGGDGIPVLGTLSLAYAGVVGFGAGFLAPLLGIGGGLVAVPALFLGLPGIGFLGARAASLGMGVVTASRSLWMYANDGQVDIVRGMPLALGALLGAVFGVWFVHLPGMRYYAQILMGSTLCVVAVRFALDVWRGRHRETDS